MDKKKTAVLFGGCSPEHDVSISSVINILENIDREKYDVYPVKITRDGEWRLLDPQIKAFSKTALDKAEGIRLLPGDNGMQGFLKLDFESFEDFILHIDVIFPVLHGIYGEDGSLQGLLAMSNLPVVGSGTLSSALCMDKIFMKQIFMQNNLPAIDYLWFTRKAWEKDKKAILNGILQEIGLPCFIKPANTGSSVGVSKANTKEKLEEAVHTAARYDRKILAEKAVDAREFEISVLGNDDIMVSEPGEVVPGNEFYDYHAKYESKESILHIPAEVDEEIKKNIQTLAKAAYRALDCAGMARVDFLYERKTGHLFVNEINTIPGFTPISMYPKLWELSGISTAQLIDRLIQLALERHEENRRLF